MTFAFFLEMFFMAFIIAQNIQRRARKFLFPGYPGLHHTSFIRSRVYIINIKMLKYIKNIHLS